MKISLDSLKRYRMTVSLFSLFIVLLLQTKTNIFLCLVIRLDLRVD